MEFLDIVDENGVPTGQKVERSRAHQEGIRHRTCHVWLARWKDGRAELLLQKRSAEKDSHPGCYDISSAGHIPAGSDWLPSALRELKEELGLTAQAGELQECGVRRFEFQSEFHGRPFHDNQVSRVYLLWRDVDPAQLTLQASEVSEVRWMDFEQLCRLVRENGFPHCIRTDELEMVARGIERARNTP